MVGGQCLHAEGPPPGQEWEYRVSVQGQRRRRENRSLAEQPAHSAHRAPQKREPRTGAIQAVKPSPQSAGTGNAIGIFDGRRGGFQRTVFPEVAPQRLAAGGKTVVAVRGRKRRQEGGRDFTMIADAPANRNPIMIFFLCLLATPAMAD